MIAASGINFSQKAIIGGDGSVWRFGLCFGWRFLPGFLACFGRPTFAGRGQHHRGGYISGRGAVAAAAARAGFPMPISGWLAAGVATAFVVVVLLRSKAGIFRLNGLLLLGSRSCKPA